MEAVHLTISSENLERISLLYGVAKEQGSLVTLREVLPLLPEPTTEEELAEALTATPPLSGGFELREGYVTEKSSQAERELTLSKELLNRRFAQTNLLYAARFVPLLQRAPFRMVAASGSTSYRSAARSKDLDFFCISSAGRLWTGLTEALIHARMFGLLHPRSPQICFSCVMDEDFADALFSREQGPLFARDALETVVLRGKSTYKSFLRKARWISFLYPNAYSSKVGNSSSSQGKRSRPSTLSAVIERLLFYIVGPYIRTKSTMLNKKLVKEGKQESVFALRVGRDHLIYESKRYSNLKRMYAENFAVGAPYSKKTRDEVFSHEE